MTNLTNISKALLAAQKEMGDAKKSANNPFFKSKYADLNSIREVCMPALHNHGIVVLQPMVHIDGKNFVKTVLLHESGESFDSLTEIIYNKQNDAQAQGSGITYARRYGLQSLLSIGAEDDDGNAASKPATVQQPKAQPTANALAPKNDPESEFREWGDELAKINRLEDLTAYYNQNKEIVDSNTVIKGLFKKRQESIKFESTSETVLTAR